MNYDSNKSSHLDSIEQRLNSPTQDIKLKERRPLREKEYDVPSDWEHAPLPVQDFEPQVPKQEKNWFFRFFMVAFLFFLGAAGFAGYMFFIAPNSVKRNIDISINAPLSIGAGEPFNFEVLIENRDSTPIVSVDLEVEFPDGTRSVADIDSLYTNDVQTIDRIEGGTVAKKNYSALLFGEEGDVKDIKVFLKYRIEESTASFEKEKVFDTVLGAAPIRFVVNNITETTSSQDVTFSFELVSNSTQVLRNVMVQGTFPFGFTVKNSSIPIEEDKKSWIIPIIRPKETILYTVTGSLEGQQGDDKFFKFITGLKTQNVEDSFVVFNTKDLIIQIKKPFLELGLAINDIKEPIIVLNPKNTNMAELIFKNNSSFPVRNAQINLVMSGDALNKTSVKVSQGFYQSNNNTITWDHTTNPNLKLISLGNFQKLSFSFNGLGLAEQFFQVNPELRFTVNVKGNRNPENNVIDTLEDTITQIIRFNTETNIKTTSEYFSQIFTNIGPIPPTAGSQTTYTGVVEITNTSNQVQNAMVTMRVPNYVQYQNVYFPQEENVLYDEVSRTITWNIGTIAPLTGYQGNPSKKLYMQGTIVPSLSQLGQAPELFNSIVFSGVDSFTQTQIEKNLSPITTSISDSKTYNSGQVIR